MEKYIDVQRAEWREELEAIRTEEDKQIDKYIIIYALLSLLAAIFAVRLGSFMSLAGFLMNLQVYRYFKRNHCVVERLSADMKVFALVAGVSYIFTIFMPYFIEYAILMEYGFITSVMQTIYDIATLCVILNAAYICVYLYGVRK